MRSLSIEEAVRRLAKHDGMSEGSLKLILIKHPNLARHMIETAERTCEPSAAEVAEAEAYLATLTMEDLKWLACIKDLHWSDARHEQRAADRYRDRPSRKAAAHRHAAEYSAGMAQDIEEMEMFSNTALGIVRRARWAEWELRLRPKQKTPEEQAAHRAAWEAITERVLKEAEQMETRTARNKRYRAKQAVADPKKAEVARLRKNLNTAKGRLSKAQARVAELETAIRDRSDPTAEVYLPGARLSSTAIQTTVDRTQAQLDAAERALAGPESVSPALLCRETDGQRRP